MKAIEFRQIKQLPIPKIEHREKCKGCDRPLTIFVQYESGDLQKAMEQSQLGHRISKGKPINWRYASYGHFCTLTCGTRYANKILDLQIEPNY